MHKATLAAGIVIIALTALALLSTGTRATLAYCLEKGGNNEFPAVISCSPTIFSPFIFSAAVGVWLVVFGLLSKSAKPILTSRIFIIASFGIGFSFWVVIILQSMLPAWQDAPEVAFMYPGAGLYFDPVAAAITSGQLILLGIAGIVLRISKNPARKFMWILAAIAFVFLLGKAGIDYFALLGAAAVIAAAILLRKKTLPSSVIAAVTIASIAAIAVSAQIDNIQEYETHPEVTILHSDINAANSKLTQVANSSRVLGPDCINDQSCTQKYGEGLAELVLFQGFQGDQYAVAGTITNTGTNRINITEFSIQGTVLSGSRQQYVDAQAVYDSRFEHIGRFSLLATPQERSKGAVDGPVTVDPGESLTVLAKGKGNTTSSAGFQVRASYQYFMEPLGTDPSLFDQSLACPAAEPCDNFKTNIHRSYWSLVAGSDTRMGLPEARELPAHFSYAGCLSKHDADLLYNKRNVTMGYPAYLPAGFSLLCMMDENDEFIQVYTNNTGLANMSEKGQFDPRLVRVNGAREPGTFIIQMSMSPRPNWYNSSDYESYKYHLEHKGELGSKYGASFQIIPGGSIFTERFSESSSAINVNLEDRRYHVFGSISTDELAKVAESLV